MFGSGAPKCPRCNKSVYQAEEVLAVGQHFHVECFRCAECQGRLATGSLCEKNNIIYCEPCYAKLFGPKGFGIGGTLVQTGTSVATPSATAASTSATIRSAPVQSSAAVAPATSIATNIKPSSLRSPGPAVPTAAPSTTAASRFGGGNKCATCKKTVYAAESVIAANKEYHDSCFVCQTCRHRLSSTTLNERDGILFCNTCYGKQFGPKGFGFGGGGAGVLTDTGVKPLS